MCDLRAPDVQELVQALGRNKVEVVFAASVDLCWLVDLVWWVWLGGWLNNELVEHHRIHRVAPSTTTARKPPDLPLLAFQVVRSLDLRDNKALDDIALQPLLIGLANGLAPTLTMLRLGGTQASTVTSPSQPWPVLAWPFSRLLRTRRRHPGRVPAFFIARQVTKNMVKGLGMMRRQLTVSFESCLAPLEAHSHPERQAAAVPSAAGLVSAERRS